ncbi:formate dehydrogenase accessory sulfurtransferase FdhD [Corynebacterium neomassiliense]|uniref:formate dehydrogenase accessory sulfurtransferase FdhD n=1 Tax=Corynebacterium neomassiliense TaxID=2079482 RepID=UPI001032625D|nr:formate dehydrogenase accessory sulfurtransferase FdhD [Corynebacterium neomassiliense]
MGRLTENARVTKVRLHAGEISVDTRADTLAVEEPLQIRVDGTDLTTTMRTPGNDIELVHGLLHAEGVITGRSDITEARYCAGAVGPMGENTYNTLDVTLSDGDGVSVADVGVPGAGVSGSGFSGSGTADTGVRAVPAAVGASCPSLPVGGVTVPRGGRVLPVRNLVTNSACGVCGTTTIDDLMKEKRYTLTPVHPTAELIVAMPRLLASGQKTFRRTGGIHAAGAFTADGRPLVIREDVGRHNAADKVIGALLLEDRLPGEVRRRAVNSGLGPDGDPDTPVYLVMSSRASFELVQKAVLAGFSGLVAVSAATSLAVNMARESGLLLTGFTRDDRFNLYSGDLSSPSGA